MKRILLVLALFASHMGFAQVPVLFYSDLTTGMCTGGLNNKGHIVTINGQNFGSAQDATHYVKLGAATKATYLKWTNTEVSFQLECALADGTDTTISVVTPAGTSNTVPIHIYTGGTIYFADQGTVTGITGSDSNNGTSPATPFLTLSKCRNAAVGGGTAGNTCYLMPGFWAKVLDDQFNPLGCYTGAFLSICDSHGDANHYIGIIGYPDSNLGHRPKIGCDALGSGGTDCPSSAFPYTLYFKSSSIDTSYYVFSNLYFLGYHASGYEHLAFDIATGPTHHIRMINAEMSGSMDFGTFLQVTHTTYDVFYGLSFHDITNYLDNKHVGALYIGTNTHDIDVGWSTFDYSCVYAGTCIQNKQLEIHTTTGLVNMPAPTLGTPTATSGGSLGAGTYDVQVTYRQTVYGLGNTGDGMTGQATETTGSTLKTVTLNGTTQTAISVPAPAGYDHQPLLNDGVTVLCNPALAFKVYICQEGVNCGSGPLYQGESVYSTPTTPGSSTASDYVQTAALNGAGAAIPSSNNTDISGCFGYNIAVHDSKFLSSPGYAWPLNVTSDKGYVRFYNNEVLNAGNGANHNPATAGEWLASDCFEFANYDVNGRENMANGGANWEIYNNTFYNCGANFNNPATRSAPSVFYLNWGASYPDLYFTMRNNIFVQPQAGQPWTAGQYAGANLHLVGSNNLCFNGDNTNCPAGWNSEGSGVNANPQFTSTGIPTTDSTGYGGIAYLNANVKPQSGSQAIDHGTSTAAYGVTQDILGLSRPQNSIYDIGNYEYYTGATSSPASVSLPPGVIVRPGVIIK